MTHHRVSEKAEQEHIKQALRSIGATVYTIGRPPRRDAVHKGTGQTLGLPDLYALLPDAPGYGRPFTSAGEVCAMKAAAHGLWIEVKAKGGRLRPEQADFARRCHEVGIAHLVGGLDVVLAYLHEHGYIREYPGQYRRSA